MKIQVAPFLVPNHDSVVHRGWALDLSGATRPLPSQLTTWDYQTELSVAGSILVHRAMVMSQAGLAPESDLEVLVMVRSSTTKIERNVLKLDVPNRESYELPCTFVLSGSELGGKLTIETLLVARNPIAGSSLSPSRPGSVLWRDTHSTMVEGLGGQFPTDAEDFSTTRPRESKAAWVLRVDSYDMDALFMSAVRLTVNSGLPAMKKLLQGSTDPATVLLARVLDMDVTRQLVQLALKSEEVVAAEVDHESMVLSGVLRSLLAQLWPAVNPTTLRTWASDFPERIELQIQNARRLSS